MASKSTPVPALPVVEVETAKKSMAGLRSLVAGGVGGVCAVISGGWFFSSVLEMCGTDAVYRPSV